VTTGFSLGGLPGYDTSYPYRSCSNFSSFGHCNRGCYLCLSPCVFEICFISFHKQCLSWATYLCSYTFSHIFYLFLTPKFSPGCQRRMVWWHKYCICCISCDTCYWYGACFSHLIPVLADFVLAMK
jgi:hypothetical protein